MTCWRFTAIFLFCSLFVTACDQKKDSATQTVQQFVKTVEGASESQQANKKEDALMKPVAYQGATLRDPFEIPAFVKNTKVYPNAILTNTALDSLKLRGVVLHAQQRWAILQAQDGQLYRVTEGMRVGLQQALLTQIDQNEIKFNVDMELEIGQRPHDVVMALEAQQEPAKK